MDNRSPAPESEEDQTGAYELTIHAASRMLAALVTPLNTGGTEGVKIAVEALALVSALVVGGHISSDCQEKVLQLIVDHARSYLPEVAHLREEFEREIAQGVTS